MNNRIGEQVCAARSIVIGADRWTKHTKAFRLMRRLELGARRTVQDWRGLRS